LWKKWKRGEYPCHEGCRSIRIPLGNTAAIAREIAEGIGPGARALSTAEASGTTIADADLIVAGAPVIQFHLPSAEDTGKARRGLGQGAGGSTSGIIRGLERARLWGAELAQAIA